MQHSKNIRDNTEIPPARVCLYFCKRVQKLIGRAHYNTVRTLSPALVRDFMNELCADRCRVAEPAFVS